MAKLDSKKVIFDDIEEFEKLSAMIDRISRKYQGWANLEFDDINQECWLKALEIIASYSGEVRYNLIAMSCYNKIKDILRKSINQKQVPMEELILDFFSEDEERSDYKSSPIGTERDALDRIVISEILDLFEKGTREREYVEQVSAYIGINEDADWGNTFSGNVCMEAEIALSLGYANQSSSGYRNLKKRVQSELLKYNEWKSYKNLK